VARLKIRADVIAGIDNRVRADDRVRANQSSHFTRRGFARRCPDDYKIINAMIRAEAYVWMNYAGRGHLFSPGKFTLSPPGAYRKISLMPAAALTFSIGIRQSKLTIFAGVC
jgi:hypothetical protein